MEAKMIVWTALKMAISSSCYVAEKYPFPTAISIVSIVLYLLLPPFFFLPFLAALAYICIYPRTHPTFPRNDLSESDLITLNASASSSDDGVPSPKPAEWNADDARNLIDLGHSEIERNRRLETFIARRRSNKFFKINTLFEEKITDGSKPDASPSREDHPPGSAPSAIHPGRSPFDLPYEPSEEKPDLAADAFQKEFALPRNLSADNFSGADASNNDDDTSTHRLPSSFPCPIPRVANANLNLSSEERSKIDGALLNDLVNTHRSCSSIASDMQVEVSETGSPPFTVDVSDSSNEGDFCKYDGADKDASCGSDDVGGDSPRTPSLDLISSATEGNSSSETGNEDGEERSALDILEEIDQYGNSDDDLNTSQETEVMQQDSSSSYSPTSVLQPSDRKINESTLDPREHMIPYVLESDVEERAVATSLTETPVRGGYSPPLGKTRADHLEKTSKEDLHFPGKEGEAEASKVCDHGIVAGQPTNNDEDET